MIIGIILLIILLTFPIGHKLSAFKTTIIYHLTQKQTTGDTNNA